MENRLCNRHIADQSIACTVFTSRSYKRIIGGRLKNYSPYGMYAEVEISFKIGTVLLIRLTDTIPENSHTQIVKGFRSISLVEVKWTKPISTNDAVWYGIGLKHLANM